MKADRLFDAITNIREDLILKAKKRRRSWISAVAAAAVVALTVTALVFPRNSSAGMLVAEAAYPAIPAQPLYEDYENTDSYILAADAWEQEYGHYFTYMDRETAESLRPFFAATIPALLEGSGNRVCSPLNLYMAVAMLAEISGGNTQAQLLALLNAADAKTLRATVREVWEKNYSPNAPKLLLANSVWLSDQLNYRTDTLQNLAKNHYTSSYRGTMGSKKMNAALRDWVNEQTGGLLKEQTEGLALSPETVFALVSAVYMNNNWSTPFAEANTRATTFHAPAGDITCDFLNESYQQRPYYWGDNFTATTKALDEGHVTFILPDEGHTVEELLQDQTVVDLLSGEDEKVEYRYMDVALSLPKFDVASEADLSQTLQDLGVTDAFGSNADFDPLTAEAAQISQIRHAARVTVDEKGCVAAAYTAIIADGEAPPADLKQIRFVADRPFIFTVCTAEGSVLFAGVVRNP